MVITTVMFFAVPGRVTDKYSKDNNLIKTQKANVLTSAADWFTS
jgi:hypothetical protein